MKQTLFTILIALSSMLLKAQLNGTYTVGDSSSYFPTLKNACDSIKLKGVSGNVSLLFKSGEYYGLMIDSLIAPQPYTITISSLAKNQDSVRFQKSFIKNSSRIRLCNLSFYQKTSPEGLVSIETCENVVMDSCLLIDSITTFFSHGVGVLNIKSSYYGKADSIYIKNTKIKCLQNLAAHSERAIALSGTGVTYFENDSIFGNVYGGYYLQFNNCYLKVNDDLDQSRTTSFTNCTINIYNRAGNLIFIMRARSVKNCSIYGLKNRIAAKIDTISNSSWNLRFESTFYGNMYVKENIFYENARFSYDDNTKYLKNIFSKDVYFQNGYNTLMKNNFFTGHTNFTWGTYNVIHNNFGPTSTLVYNAYGLIANNNIHKFGVRGGWQSGTLLNNNYHSKDDNTQYFSFDDPAATYYNPQYASSTDLHINNPILFSAATYIDSLPVYEDIDSEIRDSVTALGADLSCINLPLPDTMKLYCGAEFIPKLCTPYYQNHTWLVDSIETPTEALLPITVYQSKSIFLVDSNSNIIDSTFLHIEDHVPYGTKIYNTGCGGDFIVSTHVPKEASISWYPPQMVDKPNNNIIRIKADTSKQLIATINRGSCGIYYDTIVINVDPNPVILIFSDSTACKYKRFVALHGCSDSIVWDFGNGAKGYGDTISHTFTTNGTKIVKATNWHQGLSISQEYEFTISCLSDEELTVKEPIFKIFPNPASLDLKVITEKTLKAKEYVIFNSIGKPVLSDKIPGQEFAISLRNLPKGIYYLQIDCNVTRFIKE